MNMVLVNDYELMDVEGGRRGRGAGSGTQEQKDQAKKTGSNFFTVTGLVLIATATVITGPAAIAIGVAAGVGSLLITNME